MTAARESLYILGLTLYATGCYTVLTSFIGPWTDFILAKIIMGYARDNYTVAIGLQLMIDQDFKNTYYKQFLAGSVVVAVPITLLFLKMQKYYVEGVTNHKNRNCRNYAAETSNYECVKEPSREVKACSTA